MRTINTQNLKGVSDYFGNEQIIRNRIMNTLKSIFESYGYSPLDTPMLYNYDILTYKYREDAEILKEMYTLSDQGNRSLGLRYDLTIPFCRFIADKKDLRLPLRRYEIGKVFRNGPVKLGRSREFYQCDVDVVGIDGRDIEIEQMLLVLNAFDKLGIDIVIKWNNRKLMSAIIQYLGIDEGKIDQVIGIIDKLEKVSESSLKIEFNKIDIDNETVDKLLNLFTMDISQYNNFQYDDPLYLEALSEVNEVNEKINALGIQDKTKFTPTLARGLSIYTGTVFEFFDKNKTLTCSLGGGGRYNKIITDFINDGEVYPAVGLSFGLEPIYTILKSKYSDENMIKVYIIPMDTQCESLKLANELRNNGINTLVEFNKRKLKRCFEYADKEKIRYVIVIGEDEIKNENYTLKDMETGEQFKLNRQELIDKLK